MGIPSPVRPVAPLRAFHELEDFCESDGESKASPKRLQQRTDKVWWEADRLTLPILRMAGGPPAAHHLAATSRAFQKAVDGAWDDLTRCFPCRLYVVGGLDGEYRAVDTVDRYDPWAGHWEALPPLSSPRAAPGMAVASGRLYVLGGECGGRTLSDAQRFDPWLGRWEALPAMGAGRIRPAAVACGGFLCVLGGLDGSRPLRSAERYDPRARTWEPLATMQRPRYGCSAAAHGERIFAVGGDVPSHMSREATAEVYCPMAERWRLLTGLPALACGSVMTVGAAGQAAYFLGGLGLSGQALPAARLLPLQRLLMLGGGEAGGEPEEPALWSVLPPMPTPRHLISAASFGGCALAVGGKNSKFEPSKSVELFDPEVGAWQVLPSLPSARLRAAVAGGHL